jgi:putative redox protein
MQTATVKWTGGEQFEALGPSGHKLIIDASEEKKHGPGPMELLLLALGGCTGVDIVDILRKKRQKLDSLEMEISGERRGEIPRIWERLEILYRLRGRNAEGGPLDEAAVKHAVDLSQEKYCSVAATLRAAGTVTFRWKIER